MTSQIIERISLDKQEIFQWSGKLLKMWMTYYSDAILPFNFFVKKGVGTKQNKAKQTKAKKTKADL